MTSSSDRVASLTKRARTQPSVRPALRAPACSEAMTGRRAFPGRWLIQSGKSRPAPEAMPRRTIDWSRPHIWCEDAREPVDRTIASDAFSESPQPASLRERVGSAGRAWSLSRPPVLRGLGKGVSGQAGPFLCVDR
jgi:hypothetical protein